jgi:hypothetical protein
VGASTQRRQNLPKLRDRRLATRRSPPKRPTASLRNEAVLPLLRPQARQHGRQPQPMKARRFTSSNLVRGAWRSAACSCARFPFVGPFDDGGWIQRHEPPVRVERAVQSGHKQCAAGVPRQLRVGDVLRGVADPARELVQRQVLLNTARADLSAKARRGRGVRIERFGRSPACHDCRLSGSVFQSTLTTETTLACR